MAYEAAFAVAEERPPFDAVRAPNIARYLTGWGRFGDRAFVAEIDGAPVGAAWYRLFPPEDAGYGTVDASTPELSIAVAPERRGEGVGSALLAALIDAAHDDGFAALSLSVACANPRARELYERFGFRVVGTKGDSLTMLR